jgi:hypothetical protein
MLTSTADATKTISISGVSIPDSKLASEATELVRDTEPALLFNHSTRLYYFASIAGKRRELKFDPELLFIGPDVPRHGIGAGCGSSIAVAVFQAGRHHGLGRLLSLKIGRSG